MRSVRRLAGKILRHFGWERRGNLSSGRGGNLPAVWLTPQDLVEKLKSYGLTGRHIVDVGAHKGSYSRIFLSAFPDAYCTMFEPQVELHQHMSDLTSSQRVALVGKGVGAASGRFAFTRHPRADSQSFAISRERADARGWERDWLEVVSLDEYLQECSWPAPDIIKIDAEGWDLEVVQGASRTLDTTELVLIEASVIRLGEPHLPEVLAAMEKADFVFLGFTAVMLNYQGFPWYVEAALIRKGGVVDSNIPRSLNAPSV